jgi:hypothetical protein
MDLIYALFRKHTTSSTKSLQNYEWNAKDGKLDMNSL